MANADIRQLEMDGKVFYPQTDLNALVNNGVFAIDDEPTEYSTNLVTSDSVYKIKSETLQENREMVNSIMEDYAPVEIHGDVTNAADEEDLTSVIVSGTDVLKFKDKVYNQLVYSGMGKKILRKNMVNNVNTLTQSMMPLDTGQNTIYVIQYDYVLGENITVPSGCVLEFDGGSLNNGTITFQNTAINANSIQIFNNLAINGTLRERINVMWFGAKGDGVNDDTSAIQAAINSIKHEYSSMGQGTVYFPTPSVTYKITDTIVLDEHWNVNLISDTYIIGDRTEGKSVITWYGAENKAVISISQYCRANNITNLSINGRDVNGVIGLKLGDANQQQEGTKFSQFKNITVTNCDKGVVIGGQTASVSPDDAFLAFYSLYVYRNKTVGVDISGGNTEVAFYDLMAVGNGQDPQTETFGANIVVREGQVVIYGYISDGAPATADIYQNYGGLRVYGGWSDVQQGPFLVSYHAGWPSVISGVRHYDGGMTDANTPKSIIWTGPQVLTLESCYLFGSVEVRAGQDGQVIDLGTKFHSPNAGFIGEQLSNNPNCVISLTKGYRNNDCKLPDNVYGYIINFIKTRPRMAYAGVNDGVATFTKYIHGDNREFGLQYNASRQLNGDSKAILDGDSYTIALSYDPVFKIPNFSINKASNLTKGSTITYDNFFRVANNYSYPIIQLDGHKITFSPNPPSGAGHSWRVGDICFNTNPANTSVNVSFWTCVEAGSPGVWRAGGRWTYNEKDNGTTRPTNPPVGSVFFDTSLGTNGKPIWYAGKDGNDNDIWVYADGTTV